MVASPTSNPPTTGGKMPPVPRLRYGPLSTPPPGTNFHLDFSTSDGWCINQHEQHSSNSSNSSMSKPYADWNCLNPFLVFFPWWLLDPSKDDHHQKHAIYSSCTDRWFEATWKNMKVDILFHHPPTRLKRVLPTTPPISSVQCPTSPTTTEVSSILPPKPIGVSGKPYGPTWPGWTPTGHVTVQQETLHVYDDVLVVGSWHFSDGIQKPKSQPARTRARQNIKNRTTFGSHSNHNSLGCLEGICPKNHLCVFLARGAWKRKPGGRQIKIIYLSIFEQNRII